MNIDKLIEPNIFYKFIDKYSEYITRQYVDNEETYRITLPNKYSMDISRNYYKEFVFSYSDFFANLYLYQVTDFQLIRCLVRDHEAKSLFKYIKMKFEKNLENEKLIENNLANRGIELLKKDLDINE